MKSWPLKRLGLLTTLTSTNFGPVKRSILKEKLKDTDSAKVHLKHEQGH